MWCDNNFLDLVYVFIRNAVLHEIEQSVICVAVGTGEPGMVLGGDLSSRCRCYH